MTALNVTHDVKTTTFKTSPKIAACAQKEAQQPQPATANFPRGTSLKQLNPIPLENHGLGNTGLRLGPRLGFIYFDQIDV